MQTDESSLDQLRHRHSALTPPSGEALVVSIVGRAARGPTEVTCSCSRHSTLHGSGNADDTAQQRGRSA